MKSSIIKINNLLVLRFGEPKRKKAEVGPVDTLIATMLSQNTTDINSYKAFINLKTNFKNWKSVALANQKKIERNIRVGGLAEQKAKSIKAVLKGLQNEKGEINLDYLKNMSNEEAISELVQFNGIGVKTASCVLLFSLKREVCPVDTHVHRTTNRIGLVNTKSPNKTSELLNNNLPNGVAHSFHTNLIKLGRNICKSGNPLCLICPLIKICAYENKNLMPNKKNKKNDFLLLDNL